MFLLSSALLAITTLFYVSANLDCLRLIVDTTLFNKGSPNIFENFRRAYKYISISQVDELAALIPYQHYTPKDLLKKFTTWKLVKEYFLDIARRRNLHFNGVHGPYKWCTVKTTENFERGHILKNDQQSHYLRCLKYTNGYLLNNDPVLTSLPDDATSTISIMTEIFNILYMNWSFPLLTKHIRNTAKLTHLTMAERKMEASNIESFTQGYFAYMSEYVDNKLHEVTGAFISVENFCRHDGHKIMKDIQAQHQQANLPYPPTE